MMMNQPITDLSAYADAQVGDSFNPGLLGDCWPGIQLYYPPVKYAPSLGIYEDLPAAAQRMKKHAHATQAHTLIFDLEDGCRQKEMSRTLLRQELPALRKKRQEVSIAIRINPFRTDEYELDMKLVRDMAEYVDVVMLSKAGEAYGAAEVRDLSNVLANLPMLPKELEYRIINKHLLLVDADANLILDFIPNAIQ